MSKLRAVVSSIFLTTLGVLPARAATEARWVGPASGQWDDPTKWSINPAFPNNGTPAGTTYDAVIDATGTPYTVSVTRNPTLDSLTINSTDATVSAYDQTLTAGLIDLRAGTLSLDSGWLMGGRVQSSGGQLQLGVNGRLDGVTLAIPSFTTGGFFVRNSLTLDGTTIHLNGTATTGLRTARGAISLEGTGRILFDGTADGVVGDTSLTIGSGISIETGARGGTIGAPGATVVNKGTVASTSSGGLRLLGDWSNQGTIRLAAGNIELAGNVTPTSLGKFERTGGGLLLTGRLDLQGATIDLEKTLGSVRLRATGGGAQAGTIANGTLTSSGAATVVLDPSTVPGGRFENITLDMDLDVTQSPATFYADGLTLNGRRITFQSGAGIVFGGTKPLAGTGELVVDRPGSLGTTSMFYAPTGVMTFGPGITLRTGTATAQGAVTLGAPTTGSVGAFRNEGTILAENPGMTVEIKGDWENAGTVRLSAGLLKLGGRFTPAGLGRFERTGGSVLFTGLIDARGQTLRLDKTTGSWDVNGSYDSSSGRINGGRVEAADGVQLNVLPDQRAYLDGVTLAAPVVVNSHASLNALNGLTFDTGGSVTMFGGPSASYPTVLDLTVPTTFGGTGEFVFDGSSWNSILAYNETGPVTFGPGVALRVAKGGATIRATPTSPITIQGSLITHGFGQTVVLQGPVDVTGLARVDVGGVLVLPVLSNLSNGTLNAGEFDVRSGATLSIPGAIVQNKAKITLSGGGSAVKTGGANALAGLTDNAAGATLVITNAASLALTGSLTNEGTTVIGGTVSTAGDFSQPDGGQLRIQLYPTLSGRLIVAGDLSAAGVLGVDLLNGYVPAIGSTFDVLDFQAFTGGFDAYDLPALPAGLSWDTTDVPTTGTLAVVPEPATGALTGIGAGLALLAPRRRRPARFRA